MFKLADCEPKVQEESSRPIPMVPPRSEKAGLRQSCKAALPRTGWDASQKHAGRPSETRVAQMLARLARPWSRNKAHGASGASRNLT